MAIPEHNSRLTSRTRIAMVVRQFSTAGGLELYAHKVVEGLLDCGLNVTVLCEQNESTLSSSNLRVVEFHVAPGPKRKRLKYLYHAATRALQEHGPFDVIHSQHCPVAGANVVTFHNHTSSRLSSVGLGWEKALNNVKRVFIPAYRLRQQQDELLCLDAGCLIFPAEVMQQDYYLSFPFLNHSRKPYVVAHPGADLGTTTAVAAAAPSSAQSSGECAASDSEMLRSHESECFNFLFVGRGFRKKGLDILLCACRLLRQRGRNFALNIAGLKEKPADSFRLRCMGLQDVVNYMGFCKDMDDVYRNAVAIILPSRVEPFGMAPVQAMQRGLVPIVSRVCGVAEVLTHEHDALLLNNHLSAPELAKLMEQIMDDAGLRDVLSRNARVTARAISWSATVDETVRAYEIVLNKCEEQMCSRKSDPEKNDDGASMRRINTGASINQDRTMETEPTSFR